MMENKPIPCVTARKISSDIFRARFGIDFVGNKYLNMSKIKERN